jgi:hypothetical protein
VKALEILKRIYINNPDTRFQRNNIDINFTIHDFFNVNEAIAELEALENRSCDSCKYHLSDNGNYPLHPCCECSRFFIDSWESK